MGVGLSPAVFVAARGLVKARAGFSANRFSVISSCPGARLPNVSSKIPSLSAVPRRTALADLQDRPGR